MELELYAKRNPQETIEMGIASERIKELIEKNYTPPYYQRFKEAAVKVILFPFEFILLVLLILVSPFNKNRGTQST